MTQRDDAVFARTAPFAMTLHMLTSQLNTVNVGNDALTAPFCVRCQLAIIFLSLPRGDGHPRVSGDQAERPQGPAHIPHA
jgi:hypothetical protein